MTTRSRIAILRRVSHAPPARSRHFASVQAIAWRGWARIIRRCSSCCSPARGFGPCSYRSAGGSQRRNCGACLTIASLRRCSPSRRLRKRSSASAMLRQSRLPSARFRLAGAMEVRSWRTRARCCRPRPHPQATRRPSSATRPGRRACPRARCSRSRRCCSTRSTARICTTLRATIAC